MGLPSVRYRLSDEPRSFGLSCTANGLTLAGVPLLNRGEGRWHARVPSQIHTLIEQAHLGAIDPLPLMGGLSVIADCLNRGETPRAMIAAVLLKLPELDWDGAVRIAQANDALEKFDSDELRDQHGRWTAGGDFEPNPANDQARAPGRGGRFPRVRPPLGLSADHLDDAELLDVGLNDKWRSREFIRSKNRRVRHSKGGAVATLHRDHLVRGISGFANSDGPGTDRLSLQLASPKMSKFLWPLLCGLILTPCQSAQSKEADMKPSGLSLEMLMRQARNAPLITSAIALKLAEMVFREHYGDVTVTNHLPFTIQDRGEAWQVESTFRKYSSGDSRDTEGGQLVMVIRKLNGEILEFTRLMILPQSGIPLPTNPPSPPPK